VELNKISKTTVKALQIYYSHEIIIIPIQNSEETRSYYR